MGSETGVKVISKRQRHEAARNRAALHRQPATTLWLIRHGEVERRYQHVFGGRIDMGLSARGRRQAAALARYLEGRRFDGLYASPMRRVRETLAPLLRNGAPRPVVAAELREVDFGDWTGLGWKEVEARFGTSAFGWLDQLEQGAMPGGESAQALRARVEPLLRELLPRHAGGQVAVVCHGGVIRMALAILLDWPLSRMAAFEIEYASVTQVVWSPQKTRLHLVNFTPWKHDLQSPKGRG